MLLPINDHVWREQAQLDTIPDSSDEGLAGIRTLFLDEGHFVVKVHLLQAVEPMTSLSTRRRRDEGEVGRLFDKNSASVLSVPNDSVPLTGWKLMEQRMQMAQAEDDPNVAHYAQADVKARW
jgi:hypothetical protein